MTTAPPAGTPPAAEPVTLHGTIVDGADPTLLAAAIDKALDYRGDVTLTLDDGREVTGYLFDRRSGRTLADGYVRLLVPGQDDRVRVSYSAIRRVSFSGKDPAHGKSFETWVKKYVEKKLRGETASIESEPLE